VSRPSTRAAVALGASLGPRAATLALAVRLLDLTPGLRVLGRSRTWRTPPAGGIARGWFLNAVALLESALDPESLLARCKAIEVRLGRRPGPRWGDRVLDLDLVWMEGVLLEAPGLRVPHPRVAERGFVVLPLEEVLPGLADPRSGRPYVEAYRARPAVARAPRPVVVGVLGGAPYFLRPAFGAFGPARGACLQAQAQLTRPLNPSRSTRRR
jgi:2-amino-4-hydroxy-6-hydroxymethyldihydropteridine diphosphokinase